MKLIAKRCFPRATRVIDRFHVQQLATEAVQEIRITYRWEAIEQENEDLKNAKKSNPNYHPEVFSNGDSRKQLLARSRLLLYKDQTNWTESQKERAGILFREYPQIESVYKLSNQLRNIYNLSSILNY